MIEVRRKRHENELHEKYMQLYHNEQCYEELMQSLEEAYQNRPAELRRLDNKREKEPNWYRNKRRVGKADKRAEKTRNQSVSGCCYESYSRYA